MTNYHKDLVTGDLHIPGYLDSSDPGAVGAGVLWVDTTGGVGAWVMKYRNSADDGWEEPLIDHGNLLGLDTGADHSYIDQSVISGATPTFTGTNFTSIPDGGLVESYIKDGEFTVNSSVLVGTGAGTFAEETGDTLRTSLGLAIDTDVLAQRTIGIANTNLLIVNGTLADNDIAYATASGIEGKTVTELVALFRTAGLIGIGDNDILEVDGTVVANDIMQATAAGLKGLTYAELVALIDGSADWDFADHDLHNMKQVDFQDTHANSDSGAAITINWNECNIQSVRLTANCTFTFTAPAGPCGLTLYLLGDATVRTTTFPATAEFLDGSEPGAWGGTNNEIVGVVSLRYDSAMTPNYIMSGRQRT